MFKPTPDDKAFLDDLSRRAFRYFWEQANPRTGLVMDRSRTDGGPVEPNDRVSSIAATGFGLSALCIGAERHWITRREASQRVRVTLRFLWRGAAQEHGWFYHFLDPATGARRWQSEASSIDTAFLLAGVLTARQAFRRDPEITRLATQIYKRVDFAWMLGGNSLLLSHGWTPEKGFLDYRWDQYSEATILYLLAIGSPSHPISSWSWYGWDRPWIAYDGYAFLSGGPLFINQYSQAWIDYRGRREKLAPHIDYYKNSVLATLANRAFCMSFSGKFPGYSPDVWGITSSDSAKGYIAWGGAANRKAVDGTVVPSAPAGSLMFTPELSLPALETMKEKFGARIWGRYGFADAFNPNTGWVSRDVIGIDVGITLLSAENLRSGAVWRWFMSNPEARRAMDAVGLEQDGDRATDQTRQPMSGAIKLTPATALKDPPADWENTTFQIGHDWQ